MKHDIGVVTGKRKDGTEDVQNNIIKQLSKWDLGCSALRTSIYIERVHLNWRVEPCIVAYLNDAIGEIKSKLDTKVSLLSPNIILLTKLYNFSTLWRRQCTWLFLSRF